MQRGKVLYGVVTFIALKYWLRTGGFFPPPFEGIAKAITEKIFKKEYTEFFSDL